MTTPLKPRNILALSLAAALSLSGAALAGSPAAAAAVAIDQPTYAEHVAPILNRNCVSCHRPGQIGPMSLLSYREVRPWAKSIGRNVEQGLMPPWHGTSDTLTFANDRSLDPADRDTLIRWASSGAPAGDLSLAPESPKFPPSEWTLGEPDYIATLEQVTVPAGGPDQFHDLIARVALKEDKWLKAVEILPGNSKVVHHVIAIAIKGFDPNPQDGWLGAWAAGTAPMVFPEGTGRLLPKGSNIYADMHFHPTETEETDVTRIGLHFLDDSEVKRALANIWIMNTNFKIPAGAQDYEVRASRTFWQDGHIMGLIPHMHYRGKNFTFIAHKPDGTSETLMTIPRWDFNWQTVYNLEKPYAIEAGTRVECIAHYDNSSDNPVNPDPTIDITFGDESYDEMMIGFIDFVAADSRWPKKPMEIRAEKLTELAKEHPGRVWAVAAQREDGKKPETYAPLYLPKEGDGQFWVIWDNQLEASRVYQVEWNGNAFQAKLESPYGDFGFTGTIQGSEVSAEIIYSEERTSKWAGALAKGSAH